MTKNTVKYENIQKYYYNWKLIISVWIYLKIYFIPGKQSWIFSIITPVFSLMFRNQSNMIIWYEYLSGNHYDALTGHLFKNTNIL